MSDLKKRKKIKKSKNKKPKYFFQELNWKEDDLFFFDQEAEEMEKRWNMRVDSNEERKRRNENSM